MRGTLHLNFFVTPDRTKVWHAAYDDEGLAERHAERVEAEGHRRIAYRSVDWADDKQPNELDPQGKPRN